MIKVETESITGNKLVDKCCIFRNGYTPKISPLQHSTKKRIKRTSEPHIRGHQVNGKVYYYYVHGAGKEIYLGTARAILRALSSVHENPQKAVKDD